MPGIPVICEHCERPFRSRLIGGGTITNSYNFYGQEHDDQTGTIVNAFGLFLEEQMAGSTLNTTLHVDGGDSFFGGDVEIDGALNHDGSTVGFFGTTPATQPAAYTRNATIVEDRTLLASASATTLNNNNVLAALIADLQSLGVIG